MRALVGLTGGSAVLGARTLSFDGEDLSGAGEARWRSVRGRRIGLVLQDALVSLDPHTGYNEPAATATRTEVKALLRTVFKLE